MVLRGPSCACVHVSDVLVVDSPLTYPVFPPVPALCVSLVPLLGTWWTAGPHREVGKACSHLLCHLATSINLHAPISPTFQILPSSLAFFKSQWGVESRAQHASKTHQLPPTPSNLFSFSHWENSSLDEGVGIRRVNHVPSSGFLPNLFFTSWVFLVTPETWAFDKQRPRTDFFKYLSFLQCLHL